MNVFLRVLAVIPLVFQVTSVDAASQMKPVSDGPGASSIKESIPTQGGVTIDGSNQILRPLAPDEEEKLGRDGVKRKMKEQRR